MQNWHLIGIGVCTFVQSNTANVTARYEVDQLLVQPSEHGATVGQFDAQGLLDGAARVISAIASSGSTGVWMMGSSGPYIAAWL